jgi:hypothetical protein
MRTWQSSNFRPQRAARRFFLFSWTLGMIAAPGCTYEVSFHNVQPRVTWLAVAPAVDDVVAMHVWVRDHEGDPVDLAVDWSADGGEAQGITLAPGGHGLVGLTTADPTGDVDGVAHLILWDVSDVSGASLVLDVQADDRVSSPTAVHRSPAFTLVDGLTMPGPLVAIEE